MFLILKSTKTMVNDGRNALRKLLNRSFSRGVASTVAVCGKMPTVRLSGWHDDMKAVASDWYRVGDTLRHCENKFKRTSL